jgi:hypothetical protein
LSTTLDEGYFGWLYSHIGAHTLPDPSHTYMSLAGQLYTKPFRWVVANDDNRAEDGRELRDAYLQEKRIKQVDSLWYDLECSVLEMMIALCDRLSFQSEWSCEQWFWKLIHNLELQHFNDATYNRHIAAEVDEVLDRLLLRQYGRDGTGGLFPLRGVYPDQRRIELWHQMSNYLLESEYVNNGP